MICREGAALKGLQGEVKSFTFDVIQKEKPAVGGWGDGREQSDSPVELILQQHDGRQGKATPLPRSLLTVATVSQLILPTTMHEALPLELGKFDYLFSNSESCVW